MSTFNLYRPINNDRALEDRQKKTKFSKFAIFRNLQFFKSTLFTSESWEIFCLFEKEVAPSNSQVMQAIVSD